MASPQIEEGFTRICNELMDALIRIGMGGSNRKVFDAILRRTYGYGKKVDHISIGQLADMTGLSRRMIVYILQNLEAGRFITVARSDDGTANLIGIQKNYELWVVQEKGGQYRQAIEKQKERYRSRVVQENGGIVQENEGSARNPVKGVQETGGLASPPAPPKLQKNKETSPPIVPPLTEKPDSAELFPGVPGTSPRDFRSEAREVLRYLNEKARKSFREVDTHLDLIEVRLESGASVEQCKAMIDLKCRDWLGDSENEVYLRPATLFNATKFENYIGQIPKKKPPPSSSVPLEQTPASSTPEQIEAAVKARNEIRKKFGRPLLDLEACLAAGRSDVEVGEMLRN